MQPQKRNNIPAKYAILRADITTEIKEIEMKIDEGGYTSTLVRRRDLLLRRLHEPTIREKVVGSKPGRLSANEEERVRIKEIFSNINALLKS